MLGAIAALASAAAVVVLPANSAFGGSPTQGYTLFGAHDGDAVITLATSGQWTVRMLRPTHGLVVVGLVALDGDDYSFSAIAFPNGDVDAVWFQGNGGGFSGSSTSGRPRWVTAAPVSLAAGRYRVTLVTRRPTKVQLVPPGRRAVMRSVPADKPTGAGFATRWLKDPTTADVAHETVNFSVPAHAHQVVLVAKTLWSGNQTVDYDDLCYTAGAGHQVPCPGDPGYTATHAVNPGAPDDHWSETEMLMQRADSTGPGTANFYFAVNGHVSHRTLIAIALP